MGISRDIQKTLEDIAQTHKAIFHEIQNVSRAVIKIILWFFLVFLPLIIIVYCGLSIVGVEQHYRDLITYVFFILFLFATIGDVMDSNNATYVFAFGIIYFLLALFVTDTIFNMILEISKHNLESVNIESTPERILQTSSILVNSGLTLAILWFTVWQLLSRRRPRN